LHQPIDARCRSRPSFEFLSLRVSLAQRESAADGTSKSAASRRLVALSAEPLAAWLFPGKDRTLPVMAKRAKVLQFVCSVPIREIARRMAASLKSVVDFTDFDGSDTESEGNIARFEEAA
jgi:hypothetical protein